MKTKKTQRKLTIAAFEALEDRLLMSASPTWFASMLPPEAGDEPVRSVQSVSMVWNGKRTDVVKDEWIVKLSQSATAKLKTVAAAAQSLAKLGVQVIRGLGDEGLLLARTAGKDASAVASAMKTAGAVFYEPNRAMSATGLPNDPEFGKLWGLHNTGQTGGTADADIDAPEAWGVTSGDRNVVIGVIDTGIDYTHPDLAANIWINPGEVAGNGLDDDGNGFIDDLHGWDFANDDNDPLDDQGHGTHVAGTIGAIGGNNLGVIGVAPNVSLMALKFLNAQGRGSLDDALAAVNYTTMMRSRFNINLKATNNSWGGGGYDSSLYDAIRANTEAGMLFVAAAGNDGNNNDRAPSYPASYDLPGIISVAALDRRDKLAYFSNYGATSVDLGAPGVEILSSVPGGSYRSLSGTSMAAPHVSGAVALAWAMKPTATPAEIKTLLLNSVDPIAALKGKSVTGGRLNVFRAISPVAPPAVRVSISDAIVTEGADNTANFVVSLSRASSEAVSVNYATADDSATSDDYRRQSGKLTFTAGETSKTISVVLLDDRVAEPTQQFFVRLSSPVKATIEDGEGRCTITDNDTEPDVLDNKSPSGVTVSGAWTSSHSVGGFYGSDYIHDGNRDKGRSSVLYSPTLAAGNYEVFLRWTAGGNRASNVPVDILNAGGTQTVTVNQRTNSGAWYSLGSYAFDGSGDGVRVRTTGTNGYVIADAVRFVRTTSAPVQSPQNLNGTATDATTVQLSWDYAGTAQQFELLQRAEGQDWVHADYIGGDKRWWTVKGLTPNTQYYFAVRAQASDGRWSGISNVKPVKTPAAVTPVPSPRNLNGSATSATTVHLSWDYTGTPRQFEVLQSTDNRNWTHGENVPRDRQSCDRTGLQPNTQYYFVVRAQGADGRWSEVSNVKAIKTPNVPPVQVPRNPIGAPTSPFSGRLSWDYTGTAKQFEVLVSTDARNWTHQENLPGNRRSCDVTGLQPNTQYYFAIRAQDSDGRWSDISPVVPVKTPEIPPAQAPRNLNGSATSPTTVQLSWDYTGRPAQFQVLQSTDGQNWAHGENIPGDRQSCVRTDLKANTQYYFVIRAQESDGRWSAVSNVAAIRTPDVPPVQVPRNLNGSATSPTTVHLSWDFTGQPQKFIVEQWSAATGWIRGENVPGNRQACDRTDLQPNTDYQFAVRAEAPDGRLSDHSNVTSVHTPAVPPSGPAAPSFLHRGPVASNWFELAWTDNSNNEVRFEVWLMREGAPGDPSNVNDGQWVLSENVPASHPYCTVEYERRNGGRLRANTGYYVHIRAIGNNGWTASNVIFVRTRA